jgi:regulator of Ty1 transposition protein 103
MSAYTEEVLVDKLSKLTNTQQSIQTLSHWVMYHRKRCAQSIQVWDREIYKATKERKLVFLYLANDIMQTSRKKGGEFIREFGRVLPGAIMHIYRECDLEDKKAVQRVIKIWEERKVFPTEYVDSVRKSILGVSSNIAKGDSAVPSELLNLTTDPKSKFDGLVSIIRKIEAVEVNLALALEKFAGIRAPLMSGELLSGCTNQVEVTDLAIELEESINIITSYQTILQEDVQLRTKLIATLKACIVNQEREVGLSQEKIQECATQLAKTEPLKIELKMLYEKSPPGPLNNDNGTENTSQQQQTLPHNQAPQKPPATPLPHAQSKRAQLQGETNIITPAKKIKAQHSSHIPHPQPGLLPPQANIPLLPTPYTHNTYSDVHPKQNSGYEINNALHHGTSLYNNVTDHQMPWAQMPHMHH